MKRAFGERYAGEKTTGSSVGATQHKEKHGVVPLDVSPERKILFVTNTAVEVSFELHFDKAGGIKMGRWGQTGTELLQKQRG